jgi:threonine dehydratase
MRWYFSDTHNVAEGAAALAAAALLGGKLHGSCIGLPLPDGNVDAEVFARVLQGG